MRQLLLPLSLTVFLFGFTVPDSAPAADLNVLTAAAFTGNFGLQVGFVDTSVAFVQDNTPIAEGRYRARFYVNLNPITAVGGGIDIFRAVAVGGETVAAVEVTSLSSIAIRTRLDDGSEASASFSTPADWVAIEIDWKAADVGMANGYLDVWIDGNPQLGAGLSNLNNNSQRVDAAQLGAFPIGGLGGPPSGSFYLDDFVSTRDTYIGLVTDPPPTNVVFSDGFESGDTSEWSETVQVIFIDGFESGDTSTWSVTVSAEPVSWKAVPGLQDAG